MFPTSKVFLTSFSYSIKFLVSVDLKKKEEDGKYEITIEIW